MVLSLFPQAKSKLPKERHTDPQALAPLVFKDPAVDGPLFGWISASIRIDDTLEPKMLGPILIELLFAEDPKRLVRLCDYFPCLSFHTDSFLSSVRLFWFSTISFGFGS